MAKKAPAAPKSTAPAALCIDINAGDTITITAAHPRLKGTQYATLGFSITAKRRSLSEIEAIRLAAKTGEREDINSQVFGELVTDWQGFEDRNHKPIPCTAENRARVARMLPDLAANVVAIATNFLVSEADIADELGNSGPSGNGGLA